MSYALSPLTPAGERVVAAARGLIEPFRARAEAADKANEICLENYKDMQRTGVAAAFVPEELGGMGLRSFHDWVLTIATLAKGDGSAAIAINMHLSQSRGVAARYRMAKPGSEPHKRMAALLTAIAKGEALICSTATERGTDNLHPFTEATAADGGWRLNGEKNFVTMSPIASHLSMNVRLRDGDGEHIANVMLPIDTEGVQQQGDWDALGMRASGSQSVKFENCFVAQDVPRKVGPWGQWSVPMLVNRTLANVPLVGAFLGMAEAAQEFALAALAKSKGPARSGVHHAVAEMEILLAMSQSLMSRMGQRLDEFMAATNGGADATMEESHELLKDYQSAKWVVNKNAIDIVNHAMDLAGGGGYLARNPLSRLYRDVRAGPFMQPLSRIDAREYMGRVMLGDYPEN